MIKPCCKRSPKDISKYLESLVTKTTCKADTVCKNVSFNQLDQPIQKNDSLGHQLGYVEEQIIERKECRVAIVAKFMCSSLATCPSPNKRKI